MRQPLRGRARAHLRGNMAHKRIFIFYFFQKKESRLKVVSNLPSSDIRIFNVAFVTTELTDNKLRFQIMQSGLDMFR
jgi:PIN domain nuclease of toxin-antitoxin system